MANELAFALINPYTIAKSRTGGVIGRFISRTGLEMVDARMFGPSAELAQSYAELLRQDPDIDPFVRNMLADYVLRCYSPDPKTGRRRRVMMLLFEGPDAIQKIKDVAGPITRNMESGETIRDTYGDFLVGDQGEIRYIEPAVFIGPTPKAVENTLKLWASFSDKDGGLVTDALELNDSADLQKTLVIIKPDNFRFPSARPGTIIDLFSRSGLRIVGAKVHRMTVAEAEEFYGPVREVLREKLKGKVAERSWKLLTEELKMELPETVKTQLGDLLGPLYGDNQFYQIVQFMTGCWGAGLLPEEKTKPGKERCLILIYAGLDAVNKIRNILGPTDPSKAQPGSVRREFGQDIMVNAAHASDSPENAVREMRIVKADQSRLKEWIAKYYS
ncbi:MAG TPA: nucleoside-diphosphate kinase [Verrucomicrobia bacterium]|nr:MAG: nucleoside-diphosphate kinase [Lentisphaerae bacterium GWF2_57_35]HBA86133.1 nucleoside-diphosphate kinase [Verrucomicrobiota bacterium]